MQEYLREQVDWPQAFPEEEYAQRLAKVRSALKAAGLDAIYVTHPANVTYLTGYDMIWNHLRSLTGFFVSVANAIFRSAQLKHAGHFRRKCTAPDKAVATQINEQPLACEIRAHSVPHGCGVVLGMASRQHRGIEIANRPCIQSSNVGRVSTADALAGC